MPVKANISFADGSFGASGSVLRELLMGQERMTLAELREQGREAFQRLYAEDSAVRHLAEARRENNAAEFSMSDADAAFEAMLDQTLDLHDEVERSFAEQPLKD